jgi:hypothetical protein
LQVKWPILLIKINLSKVSICRQHIWGAVKIPTMENVCFVSIWLVGMLKICHAKRAIIGNLCSSLHHQYNTNLQVSASTRNCQNPTSSLYTILPCIYCWCCGLKNKLLESPCD